MPEVSFTGQRCEVVEQLAAYIIHTDENPTCVRPPVTPHTSDLWMTPQAYPCILDNDNNNDNNNNNNDNNNNDTTTNNNDNKNIIIIIIIVIVIVIIII